MQGEVEALIVLSTCGTAHYRIRRYTRTKKYKYMYRGKLIYMWGAHYRIRLYTLTRKYKQYAQKKSNLHVEWPITTPNITLAQENTNIHR